MFGTDLVKIYNCPFKTDCKMLVRENQAKLGTNSIHVKMVQSYNCTDTSLEASKTQPIVRTMTIVVSRSYLIEKFFCLAIQLVCCTARTLMKGENWLRSSGIRLKETPHEILSTAFFQLSPKLWLRQRGLVVSPGNRWLRYSAGMFHTLWLFVASKCVWTNSGLPCKISHVSFFAHPMFLPFGVQR